jgi:hypothetical protein
MAADDSDVVNTATEYYYLEDECDTLRSNNFIMSFKTLAIFIINAHSCR